MPATTVSSPAEPLHLGEPGAEVTSLSLGELRALRRRLRAEAERTAYWHRLAKARLDLAVAGALTDDLPGRLVDPGTRSGHGSPCFASLRDLLLGDELAGHDVVERLRRIDDAERMLRGYGSSVRAATDEATGELVRRYSDEPTTCLDAVPHPA